MKYCIANPQEKTNGNLINECYFKGMEDKIFYKCSECELSYGVCKMANHQLAYIPMVKHVKEAHPECCYKCKRCDALYMSRTESKKSECKKCD